MNLFCCKYLFFYLQCRSHSVTIPHNQFGKGERQMGLSIFTGDRKENIIKTLFRSRMARVGLIGCSIYVYRSYDFGGTLGQKVATAVLVSAMALNTLFIPSRMLRCRHGKRFFVSALPKNRFRGSHLEKKIEHREAETLELT